MYIKYEDLDNVEKIKEILISLGIKEELLNHKAFNVVLKTIWIKTRRAFNEENANIRMVSSGDNGSAKTINFASNDNLFSFSLTVEGKTIKLDNTEVHKDGKSLFKKQINFSVENGLLIIRELSGSSFKKDILDNVREDVATIIKRRFNSDGIEEYQEHYMVDGVENISDVGVLTKSSYTIYGYESLVEAKLKYSPEKVNKKLYRRDDVDIVSAYFVNDGKESEFYDQINNEHGLQEIIPTNFQGRNNYPIEPLTPEQFETLIKHCNSREMQEALLRRYSDQRTKITYQKEDHSRGTPRR